jgi:hypothetical protein
MLPFPEIELPLGAGAAFLPGRHMAFGPRRSDFIEAVSLATIVLSFAVVAYVAFFYR